ncbi:MAG: efflux RND transporter periplasmic adaptor subunit [Nitrospira sp.]|nr:efflux RND transporter periplasmic adaptor subunit [Nitrospira sp.]
MKYIVTVIAVVIAVVVALGLYNTSPKTKKAQPQRSVPVVETVELNRKSESISFEAFGTVVPSQKITLQGEVEGRIVMLNPELLPGGIIKLGETVVKIDPAEYELVVTEYRAALDEVLVELDLEQGKQVIAQRELQLMEADIKIPEQGRILALREPQLRLVKSRIEKARSRVAAANLSLSKTTVTAPFNAIVIEKLVDMGQLVSRQSPLAVLAGTDVFWVQISVPVSMLQRVRLPDSAGEKGSEVKVYFEPVNGEIVQRNGHVLRVMGDLDPEGRMARLLVVIDDPLRLNGSAPAGRLLLGSYVRVEIEAGSIADIYTIPRSALREGDLIWVKDSEDKLQVREVKIMWRMRERLLVEAELKQGDLLITSRLQSPLPGMKVVGID